MILTFAIDPKPMGVAAERMRHGDFSFHRVQSVDVVCDTDGLELHVRFKDGASFEFLDPPPFTLKNE